MKPPLLTKLQSATAVASGIVLATTSVYAADKTWNNAGSGLWGTAANWTGGLPVAGDNAVIGNGGTAQIQTGDSFSLLNVNLNSGTITQSGGTLLSTSRVKLGNVAGPVTFTQTTGSFTTNERLYIADGNGGVGTTLSSATVAIGGTVSANDYLVVGRQGGTADVTVTGTLSKFNATNRFIVGDGGGVGSIGTGNLTVQGTGAVSSFVGFDIGNGDRGIGTVTVKDNATLTTGTNLANNALVVGGGAGAGSKGVGTLNIQGSAAVSSSSAELWVANGAGSTGTINMTGGTLAVNNWVAIGRGATGTTGTLNISGGTITKTGNGNFILNGGSSTLTQTGGAINVNAGDTWLSEASGRTATWNASAGTANLGAITRVGYGGTGTMSISGSANYTNGIVYVSSNSGSVGTLNLNGGTFTATRLEEGAGTGKVNFNGGVLKAAADSATFITDFESGDLDVQTGGIKIDSNSHALTITSILTGVGSLTKIGAGTLTLNGAQAYTGSTLVEGGTLSINTAYLADGSDVNLSSGTVFELNTGGASDTVRFLIVNGVVQASGTYGAIGSGAEHEVSYLTGNGFIFAAIPEPHHYALGTAGLLGALIVVRRRRLAA